jgi:HNH endonuclease
MLTADQARQIFDYDRESGQLTFAATGVPAGFKSGMGYLYVRIDGRDPSYLVHRVIWLIVHGKWPVRHVDHKNGNKVDNAINNLREATPAENLRNMKMHRDNAIGLKGASWSMTKKKFRADIMVAGKRFFLGYYKTAEEAHHAYCRAAVEKHGEFANFG